MTERMQTARDRKTVTFRGEVIDLADSARYLSEEQRDFFYRVGLDHFLRAVAISKLLDAGGGWADPANKFHEMAEQLDALRESQVVHDWEGNPLT